MSSLNLVKSDYVYTLAEGVFPTHVHNQYPNAYDVVNIRQDTPIKRGSILAVKSNLTTSGVSLYKVDSMVELGKDDSYLSLSRLGISKCGAKTRGKLLSDIQNSGWKLLLPKGLCKVQTRQEERDRLKQANAQKKEQKRSNKINNAKRVSTRMLADSLAELHKKVDLITEQLEELNLIRVNNANG